MSRSVVKATGTEDPSAFDPAIIRPKILGTEAADCEVEASEVALSTTIGEVWRDMILVLILIELGS